MAEFKISRIRYTWEGDWTASTAYNKDDVVHYNGSSYACIRQHTSSTTFNTDQIYTPPGETLATPAWSRITQGFNWRNNWAASTDYYPNDVVRYGGYLWLNTTAYTSTSVFDDNLSNWAIYATTTDWDGTWVTGTRYGVGDLVKRGSTVYKCIVGHTATSLLQDDLDAGNWEIYVQVKGFVGDWADATTYVINDLVSYGGSLMRVIDGHVSSGFLNPGHFETEIPGSKVKGEWAEATYYAEGDLVQHGGYVYRSTQNHQGQNPSDSIYQPDEVYWAIIQKGRRLVGDWSATASYKTGDVVRRGGYTYVALLDTTDDGSSLDYLDAGNWEIVVPGSAWKNAWSAGIDFAVGDVVTYRGSAYQCNYEHTSSDTDGEQNFPGDNGEGYDYWDIILEGSSQAGLVKPGDLLSYGLSRSNVGDGSTLGATNIPIGGEGNLLTANADETISYSQWGISQKFFYVNPYTGVDDYDDADRGLDISKPLKSIRRALQLADDGDTTTHKTIKLSTGEFKEVLPLVVPAKTVVLGDELRSTTVKPSDAGLIASTELANRLLILARLKIIGRNIVLNEAVSKSTGNTEDQVYVIDSEVTGTDPFGNDVIITTPIFGDVDSAAAMDEKIDHFIQYINFHVGGTGTDPDVDGTNTALASDDADVYAGRALVANKKFIVAELNAYMNAFYSDWTKDEEFDIDVGRYLEAIEYDLKYPGVYKTNLEGQFYANKTNGSNKSDMFYMRDATGLRLCTLKDLTGTLNPANVFQQYQRPTGGNYVSLDPGWGPDDDRCWITTRSPYVQNCSTFGNNCTGQKIDGALHNGGNKSIVSNDFTQVISDGIGAHVLNNGRAELVSVFTYYAQVGYLTENGGIIRSTNGNCSYGFIGALADGIDPTETPIQATVNTRQEEAQVASAFAGEVNDEILALEFTHFGQNYTDASYTFVGSGTQAEVAQEDFRDDAMYEARIVTGEASAAAGGGGYTLIGNNAQGGDATTITLAQADDNEEANLLGLRILIVSGPGTGQYGYVTAYNSLTKVLNVARESDGEPGWDHVLPGKPILDQLITTTQYRFEPRITFSEPPTTSSTVSLAAGTTWGGIVYGETKKVYTSVLGDVGTGDTIDVPQSVATFNVTKTGKDYTVTLRNGGAGYAVNDIITIEGLQVGGESTDNDITITVTSVSEDSTNSIVTFTYTGTGSSGNFVAIANTGNTVNYSKNGSDWNTGSLPSSGSWIDIASGTNGTPGFVAIKRDSDNAAYSDDGESWGAYTLPADTTWESVAYGDGVYVAVASQGGNAAFSEDGRTWTAANIPAGGDSTFDEWKSITYGKKQFVAVSSSQNLAAVGTWNGATITWTTYIMDVIDDSSQKDWFKVVYGNNKYFALAESGEAAYSFDGETWYPKTMPSPDGSTVLDWNDVEYGQGVFMATVDTDGQEISGDPTLGPVDYVYTSPDCITWTKKTVAAEGTYGKLAFGNPDITSDDGDNRKGMWIVLSETVQVGALRIYTGTNAKGRAFVESGRISQIRMWDPGSGYPASGPTFSVIDPNNTGDLVLDTTRIADRVLAQPSWINRGSNYKTSSTTITVTGDGFADIIPVGKFITVSGVPYVIGPGAQLRITGNDELYTVVAIETESQESENSFTLKFRVSPELKIENDVYHNTAVTINTRYSQNRITGHDFLDVGTGNFTETNYPELYSRTYLSYPENEIQELNGGRVFYTSTDQSGNFRCGELFAVEQATGIVTISADFFDLNGLTELALGGIRVGGTGAVIREFSTDPLFTADSNNIVPTQRAIKAYLQNRLNVGGADLSTASFIAGTVKVGPTGISNTAGLSVNVPVIMDFKGPKANIQGSMLGQAMFFRSFKDRA